VTLHAFADESQRRGTYLMCAVVVQPNRLVEVRAAMRSELLAGQRRLHFAHESKRRRRSILAAVTDLQAEARIYLSTDRPDGPASAAYRPWSTTSSPTAPLGWSSRAGAPPTSRTAGPSPRAWQASEGS
jgi:hypothetical protein